MFVSCALMTTPTKNCNGNEMRKKHYLLKTSQNCWNFASRQSKEENKINNQGSLSLLSLSQRTHHKLTPHKHAYFIPVAMTTETFDWNFCHKTRSSFFFLIFLLCCCRHCWCCCRWNFECIWIFWILVSNCSDNPVTWGQQYKNTVS